MVKLLLDHGADPNAHHGAALHKAANLDRREIVDLLLVNGADPNGGVDSSSPPIEYAKENVRRSLLKAGA
jgi:ankyrin repeat protein